MKGDALDRGQPRSLVDILDRAIAVAGDDRVSVGELVDAFGDASFAPLLLLPAIAVVSPLSGVPTFSSICGIVIFLIAGQWLLGRSRIWLPGWILRRHVAGARMRNGLGRMRKVAAWLDRNTRARLTVLFHRPMKYVPVAVCALFGAVMPFLEFVPFSSSLLGLAVALLALSMLMRDGLLALLSLLPIAAGALAVTLVGL